MRKHPAKAKATATAANKMPELSILKSKGKNDFARRVNSGENRTTDNVFLPRNVKNDATFHL